MAIKTVFDIGTDDVDTPESSEIIETQESNLDVVSFVATRNFTLNNLDEFEFKDFNNNVIFAGAIRSNLNGDKDVIYGFDYGIELGEIRIRKNFQNMTPIEIMEDVITNFTSLTFDAGTVTTSRNVTLYPSPNKRAIQIINDMHRLLATTHFVNTSKVFKLEFEGSELNTNVLEVGVNADVSAKGWEVDTSQIVKNLVVNGDVKRIEESETLSGTGAQTTFTIANPYVDVKVEHPIATKLEPEIEDFKAGDYQINKETAEIIFNVAPAFGVDNILITYVYQLQVNFSISEITNAQVLAGTNPHEVEINANFLKEVLECKDYAEKYKNKFQNAIRNATILTTDLDLTKYRANQRIRIKDSIHLIDGVAINDEFIIKEIVRSFGAGSAFIELTVGDSTNFVYDIETEIDQRIQDFNNTNPSAEIFNEGISMQDQNILQVEFDTSDIDLKVATLPQNILVYDINRTYINANDYTGQNGFRYINGSDYINLFEDVE